MIFFLVFAICFFSCIAGAICGIGGGVIIKPALDAFGIMDVTAISFLSGCTVLSMTAYSVVRSRLSGQSRIDLQTGSPIALGAALGGVAGKQIFQIVRAAGSHSDSVGLIQAVCLLLVTAATLLYTLQKARIPTHRVQNPLICGVIGLVLGMLSSFLGIGGGPVNLAVLIFFFSMDTKTAAENSLYIILFSQITSLLVSLLTRSVPEFPMQMLWLMVGSGIGGGICGRCISKKLRSSTVDRLFVGLMVLMIFINLYNIYQFMMG